MANVKKRSAENEERSHDGQPARHVAKRRRPAGQVVGTGNQEQARASNGQAPHKKSSGVKSARQSSFAKTHRSVPVLGSRLEGAGTRSQATALLDMQPRSQVPEESNPQTADGRGQSRREGMAAVARRRAAHFAHFQADDEETAQNAHTGGSEARKLGPWSSAVELIEARTAAAKAREGKLSEAAKADIGSLADDAIAWAPKRSLSLGARPPVTVGPLFQACLTLLVDHIEDVETLCGLPDIIKIKLASAVCKARKLDLEVAKLFTEGGADEVELPDCTKLTQESLISVLTPAISPRLERLGLNLCGRGFGDETAKALSSAGRLPGLKCARFGGAYRLTDAGLLSLLCASPNLEELHLPQCPRIQGSALEQLPTRAPNLRVLNLADCRGLSAGSLRGVLCGPANLGQLQALTLNGIAEVDDQLLIDVCVGLPRLARLSINFCVHVSDRGLRGIAAGCGPRLTELRMDEVASATDEGMAALGESCANLQVLSLQRCHHVTDGGLASVVSRGMLSELGANKVSSLSDLTVKALIAACSEKLEEADFSWCRKISSRALGLLVDSCSQMQKLTLFGCSQVGNEFLHGHSNANLQIVGATGQRSGEAEMAKLTLLETDSEE